MTMMRRASITKVEGKRFPGNNWMIRLSSVDAKAWRTQRRYYGGSGFRFAESWPHALTVAREHIMEAQS